MEKTLRIVVTSGLVNRSRFTQGIRDSLTQPLQKARRGARLLHVVQGCAETRACQSQHAHAQYVACLFAVIWCGDVSWEHMQVTLACATACVLDRCVLPCCLAYTA